MGESNLALRTINPQDTGKTSQSITAFIKTHPEAFGQILAGIDKNQDGILDEKTEIANYFKKSGITPEFQSFFKKLFSQVREKEAPVHADMAVLVEAGNLYKPEDKNYMDFVRKALKVYYENRPCIKK